MLIDAIRRAQRRIIERRVRAIGATKKQQKLKLRSSHRKFGGMIEPKKQ